MRVHVHERVPVRVYVNARVCERKTERGGGLSGGKGEGTMGSCGKGGLECMDGALGVCVCGGWRGERERAAGTKTPHGRKHQTVVFMREDMRLQLCVHIMCVSVGMGEGVPLLGASELETLEDTIARPSNLVQRRYLSRCAQSNWRGRETG